MSVPPTLYCYIHPSRSTTLRCNRCERPICPQCAVRTPTGYRCRECVREHQKVFNTALWYDYIIAFAAAALGSALASFLVMLISAFFWGLLVLVLSPGAGAMIGNLILRLVRGRRSRALYWTAALGVVAGGLPALFLFSLPAFLAFGTAGFESLLALLPAAWQILYLALAVPSAYAQLSGIRLGR